MGLGCCVNYWFEGLNVCFILFNSTVKQIDIWSVQCLGDYVPESWISFMLSFMHYVHTCMSILNTG